MKQNIPGFYGVGTALKDLKETNKKLYDEIVAEITESMKGKTDEQIKEATEKAVQIALDKLNEKSTKADKAAAMKTKVTETVNSSKLPEKARARFIADFIRENADIKESEVDSKLKEAVISEIKYLNEMGAGIKIDVDPGKATETAGKHEDITAGILEAAGLTEKKKDKE